MKILDFVAIDFEKWNDTQTSVCEVGMVKYIDGKKVDCFHSLIKPISGLTPNLWAKLNLKHITVQALLESPTFAELFEKMKAFIGDSVLVCHNVSADINYIYNCEVETGLRGLYCQGYIDTKEVTKGISLEKAYKEYLSEDLVDHHQAMYDAENLASLFVAIQDHIDVSGYIHTNYVPSKEKGGKKSEPSKHISRSCSGNVPTDDLVFFQGEITPSFFKGKNVLVSCGSESKKNDCKKMIEQFGGKPVGKDNKKIDVLIVGNVTGKTKHHIAEEKQAIKDSNFYVIHVDAVLNLELETVLFTDEEFPTFKNNPFENRKICIDGTISGYSKEYLRSRILKMGGEIVTGDLSKNVHYIVVDKDISDSKKTSYEKLVFNGFNIRILRKEDIDMIFSGQYSDYAMPMNLEKAIHLTKEHYEKKHVIYQSPKIEDSGGMYIPNPIYGKNMYLGSGIKGDKATLSQMLGLVGVFSGGGLSDSTQIIVLSQDAYEALENDMPHEEISRIEQTYNNGLAVWYDYLLTTESEILSWFKTRIDLSGDTLLGGLYHDFLNSRNA